METIAVRCVECARTGWGAVLHAPEDGDGALARQWVARIRFHDADDEVSSMIKLTAVSFAVVVLSGCSLMQPNSTSTPKVDLVGGTWVAEDIDGRGVIDDAQSTLVFGTDGKLSGRGACNGYGGTVDVKGAQIIVGELMATKMA